nr:hypothetical protein [Tanacetum cinerariifolium]
MANDDPLLTTMRFIPQHEVVQKYDAILLDYLTTQTMKESEAYKTYHDLATGKVQPKQKYVRRSSRSKTKQAPKLFLGKSVKAMARVVKSRKKKQPALGLETLTEVALTKAEQLKLATKRSLIQTHNSHASGSGVPGGTGVKPRVIDVPTYCSNEEEISWKSSDEEDDDVANIGKDEDDNDQEDDDNTDHDDDSEQTDSDNDGDDFVHPKFSTQDDKARQEKEVNKEESFDLIVQTPSQVKNTDDEDNDDDSHGQQQSSSVSSRFVSNMLNPSPDKGINSFFNLNIESTPWVDVAVTTIAEPPLLSATTLHPPATPIIPHLQQTPVPSPVNVQSSSPQDLPNFGSLFGFDHRLKTLEVNFSECMQTNYFGEAISLILSIVDKYIDNQTNEAIKIIKEQVKEQVKAQVSKILPKIKKTVNEQLEAKVLTRSSNSSKTSHAVATNLSELELKKILIDKMESNKSIYRSDEQKNIYKPLDKDEEPFAGSNQGSKRRRAGKEQESTSAPKEKTSKTTGKSTEGSKSHHKSASESAQAEEPMYTTKDLEGPAHLEFDTAQKDDSHTSFNELMDTPLDFSAFVMNRLKVDTLTPELLASLTYELMKGSCKSLVELEFFLKEVYKATTDQLDWNNPEGQ